MKLKEYVYDFLLMVQFLTRLPVKKSLPCESKNFRDGGAMLPLVGLLLGAIQWGVYKGCERIFPNNISAIIVLAIGMILIGCLHQDGFGDIFDGFFSFKGDKEKIIEIMKDSRIGTFATIALIFDILIKYATLTFILDKNMSYVIIITPVISRCALTFLFLIGKNAKKTGTGNFFVENSSIGHFIFSLLCTIVICIAFVGSKYTAIALIVALIVTLLFLQLCKSKIGGVSGDCLGANNEFVEIFTFMLFTVLLNI